MLPLITIITPITGLPDPKRNLSKWAKQLKNQPISLIIIHDRPCAETSTYISEIIRFLDEEQVVVIEGVYGSPGAARNAGLELAKSEWVVFWDADDVGEPENLLIAITKYSESSILVGSFTLNSDFDESPTIKILIEGTRDKYLQMASQGGLWRYLIKREVIGNKRFSANMMGEDLLFLFELQLPEAKVITTEMIFYNYYYGSTLHLTSNQKYQKQVANTFNELQSNIRSRNSKLNLFETGIYFKLMFSVCKHATPTKKVRSLNQAMVLLIVKRFIVARYFVLYFRNFVAEHKESRSEIE